MTSGQALDTGPVMLDDTLLREVQSSLGAAGVVTCVSFVLVELGEGGLRTAVVDAGTGVSLVERADGKLNPHMLDLAVADHLVRVGRVQRPETAPWATELIDLVGELRARLATGDGAFAMGTEHIGLTRISRREMITALHPHLMAAQSQWQATALDSVLPVGAIVFMPEHRQWPGLFDIMAQLAPIPAVALDAAADPVPRGSARHGSTPPVAAHETESTPVYASMQAPEQAIASPQPATPTLTVTSPSGVETTPVFSSMSFPVIEPARASADPVPVPVPVPVPAPTEPPHTERLSPTPPPVPTLPPVAAPASVATQTPVSPAAGPAAPTVPSHTVPSPTVSTPAVSTPIPMTSTRTSTRAPRGNAPRSQSTNEQDVYFGQAGGRGPITVHDHRLVKRSEGPRHYSPPVPMNASVSEEARRVHNRRLVIGATVVGSAAVIGAIILVMPWLDSGSSNDDGRISVAQTSQPPQPPAAPTTSRPPLDLDAAGGPAVQYTTPPPPPVTQVPAPPPPRRAAPVRPRQRSIPNPIPGLPPILLP